MNILSTTRSVETAGKSLGIVVFLLGVAMLISVFIIAYRDLLATAEASVLSRLFNLPVALVYKGVLLFVMGVVASAIANKGIALYQAARTGGE